MPSSLPRRIAVAAVAIPAVFTFVYVGGWLLVIALQCLAVLGTSEVYRLARSRDVHPLAWLGYLGAVGGPALMFAISGAGGIDTTWIGFAATGWFLAVMAGAVWQRNPNQAPLAAIAVTVFGAVYTGVLPAFLLLLRHAETTRGPWAATWLVFLPLAVTWVSDSMAMAGGMLIGGPKLSPAISPNKTWAGTVTGSIAATAAAPLYGVLALGPYGIVLAWWKLAVLGLALSIVGHVGDLAESLLKREAGVKDSGRAFPGHGGVLDRLDSLYWVLPTATALLSAYGAI